MQFSVHVIYFKVLTNKQIHIHIVYVIMFYQEFHFVIVPFINLYFKEIFKGTL